MDIVAHTLWAAAGATVLNRRRQLSRSTVIATLVLAALPDLLHLLPIAGEWLMFHRHILEHGDVGMMGQFIAVYRTPPGCGPPSGFTPYSDAENALRRLSPAATAPFGSPAQSAAAPHLVRSLGREVSSPQIRHHR